MLIWYGRSLYGRVDQVPGHFHIATLFGHVYSFPLAPVSSFVIPEDGRYRVMRTDSVDGVPIPLSMKSVLFGYVRAALWVTSAYALFWAVFVDGAEMLQNQLRWDEPLRRPALLLGLSAALLLPLSYRWTHATAERADEIRELMEASTAKARRVAVALATTEPEALESEHESFGRLWYEHGTSILASVVMWIVAGGIAALFAFGGASVFATHDVFGSVLLFLGLLVLFGAWCIQRTTVRFYERGVVRRTAIGRRQLAYDETFDVSWKEDDAGRYLVTFVPHNSDIKRIRFRVENAEKDLRLRHVLAYVKNLIGVRADWKGEADETPPQLAP